MGIARFLLRLIVIALILGSCIISLKDVIIGLRGLIRLLLLLWSVRLMDIKGDVESCVYRFFSRNEVVLVCYSRTMNVLFFLSFLDE